MPASSPRVQVKPQIITERQYARPADVVRATGLSLSKVMSAIWDGELEAFRVGGSWLIPLESVDVWIRGGDRVA